MILLSKAVSRAPTCVRGWAEYPQGSQLALKTQEGSAGCRAACLGHATQATFTFISLVFYRGAVTAPVTL